MNNRLGTMWNEFVSGLANFAYTRPKWTDMCGSGALYEKTNFEIGIYSKKKKMKQDSLLGKGQLGQHSYSTLEGRLMIIESQ